MIFSVTALIFLELFIEVVLYFDLTPLFPRSDDPSYLGNYTKKHVKSQKSKQQIFNAAGKLLRGST